MGEFFPQKNVPNVSKNIQMFFFYLIRDWFIIVLWNSLFQGDNSTARINLEPSPIAIVK